MKTVGKIVAWVLAGTVVILVGHHVHHRLAPNHWASDTAGDDPHI
jgi:hypothetical protein